MSAVRVWHGEIGFLFWFPLVYFFFPTSLRFLSLDGWIHFGCFINRLLCPRLLFSCLLPLYPYSYLTMLVVLGPAAVSSIFISLVPIPALFCIHSTYQRINLEPGTPGRKEL